MSRWDGVREDDSLAARAALPARSRHRCAAAQADHGAQYSQADIAAGYRVYSSQCVQCHGGNGDGISGVDLRRGVFRRAASDEDLARVITTGVPGAGMPPFTLEPAELTGVIAFIRAGFDQTVSVTRRRCRARPRRSSTARAQCATCHRVRGRGALAAPDLSGVGLVAHASAPCSDRCSTHRRRWCRSTVRVRIVTKSGETIDGRRLNEDTYTVQLLDARRPLRSLAKSDIRTLDVATASPMPSYASRLTADEIADLVGYLASLREP